MQHEAACPYEDVDANSSGFKTPDQVQGQDVPRIENGAYTQVHEYFTARGNAAIEPFELH